MYPGIETNRQEDISHGIEFRTFVEFWLTDALLRVLPDCFHYHLDDLSTQTMEMIVHLIPPVAGRLHRFLKSEDVPSEQFPPLTGRYIVAEGLLATGLR
jgi:hypothetical protein